MSVREVTMFQAVCNRCRTVAQECKHSEHWAWSDKSTALNDAEDSHDWLVVGDDAWCSDCVVWDEVTGDWSPRDDREVRSVVPLAERDPRLANIKASSADVDSRFQEHLEVLTERQGNGQYYVWSLGYNNLIFWED